MAWGGWLEGSISRSSLQFHFLQTLEHRTDVSVTSTSPWWEAPEEQGVPWVPAGNVLGSLQLPTLSCSLPRCQPCAGVALCQCCPSWEGVLGTTWSLKPPCSPSSPPACPGPTGIGNLWICGSETPTELHPSECSLLLARLALKG